MLRHDTPQFGRCVRPDAERLRRLFARQGHSRGQKLNGLTRQHSESFDAARTQFGQPEARRVVAPANHEISVAINRHARAVLRPCKQSVRSEEHTSELQSLMRISYAVF